MPCLPIPANTIPILDGHGRRNLALRQWAHAAHPGCFAYTQVLTEDIRKRQFSSVINETLLIRNGAYWLV